MTDSNIIPLKKLDTLDPLEAILRQGARQLLPQAIEAEVSDFLAQHKPGRLTTPG